MCVCLSGRWLAWTCDAIDFFSVSLSVPLLQKQFNKDKASTIVRCLLLARSPFAPHPRMNCLCSCSATQTQAITLTLLFRSFGAVSASSSHVSVVMLHYDALLCASWLRCQCHVRLRSGQHFSRKKRPSSSQMCVSRSILMLLYPCRSSLASCLIASGGNGPW